MLEVRDDGRGFEVERAVDNGLIGMRERALLVGGALEVRSRPGAGTVVRLTPAVAGRRVTPLRTRILLADDHAMVRRGLRLVLDAEPDLEVVAEATDGIEALALGLREDVHLAVLDVAMPGMTGLQVARELSRRRPELRTLMLSMHDGEQYLFEALRSGASGYVLKADADQMLIDACRATMRGEPFLYPAGVTALVRERLERGEPSAGRRAHAARDAGRQAHRRGAHEPRDRRPARHQRAHRRAPPRAHPRQARAARPRGADALRDPPRPGGAVTPIGVRPPWRAGGRAGTLQDVHSLLIVDDHAAVRAGLRRPRRRASRASRWRPRQSTRRAR